MGSGRKKRYGLTQAAIRHLVAVENGVLIMLFWISAVAGMISAGFWFYASISVSRETELKRREEIARRSGGEVDKGGVVIVDGDNKYDLIATLRHQAKWNKWGAIFAAIALLIQALAQISPALI